MKFKLLYISFICSPLLIVTKFCSHAHEVRGGNSILEFFHFQVWKIVVL